MAPLESACRNLGLQWSPVQARTQVFQAVSGARENWAGLLSASASAAGAFHVAFLKKFDGTAPTAIPTLPPMVRERTVPVPQEVVCAKPTTNLWELLVKWAGRTPAEASWEQLEASKEAYPDFQLEDKLFRQEGGNVMDSYFHNQYSRKKGTMAPEGPSSG
jgi:hypothetical protein